MKTPLNAACVSILAATIGEAATAKRPSMQYPRWLIDKSATIRFKSDRAHAASDASKVERALRKVNSEECQQHRNAAEKCVKKKLGRSAVAVFAAPDFDE